MGDIKKHERLSAQPEHPASDARLVSASRSRSEDPPSLVRTKGTSLAAVVSFVRLRYGEEGLARLVSKVASPAAAAHLGGVLLRASWYPFEDFVALLEAGDLAFPERTSFAARQGAHGAETDLKGVYRAFVRLASPRFLVERASAVWKQYYSSGALNVTDSSPGHIGFELQDFASPHALHCEALLAWCLRAAELTGIAGGRS